MWYNSLPFFLSSHPGFGKKMTRRSSKQQSGLSRWCQDNVWRRKEAAGGRQDTKRVIGPPAANQEGKTYKSPHVGRGKVTIVSKCLKMSLFFYLAMHGKKVSEHDLRGEVVASYAIGFFSRPADKETSRTQYTWGVVSFRVPQMSGLSEREWKDETHLHFIVSVPLVCMQATAYT